MLGYFIGQVCKYRLSVCVQNLARAFPHLSYQEINIHRHNFYQNLARIIWENFHPRQVKIHLSESALETINRLQKQRSQAILLLGHYGNWELITKIPQFTNIPTQALYKPLKNRFLNYLSYKKRTKHGMRLLPAQHALRILLREKQTPSITLFIADQFPGHDNGIAVEFLQQTTFMFSGAEKLARQLNTSVGYVSLQPLNKLEWELDIKPICDHAAATSEGLITKQFASMLEKSIQKDPSWWLWTHRRWK
ncbi:lysophospholipid acyltransferase family protein [Sphingobacterium sp. IITKGP-BTPF85]|uniref:lysophospholipid acyltransferase family protein n=1 Tax=Sphingobacterium sp. IITKGP-BTPF85 TaxID=1338009 RepID=UPI000389F765|nr:lysophospholipid acyltransferase family protein [Sphingobacterium sp. IITKGP-BTPF85]KKX51313.1 hypothetical protein L950_0205360 [Sphingobacterium sp. IITKGP-BTPF85]